MSVQTVCIGWQWRPYRYTRSLQLFSLRTV